MCSLMVHDYKGVLEKMSVAKTKTGKLYTISFSSIRRTRHVFDNGNAKNFLTHSFQHNLCNWLKFM